MRRLLGGFRGAHRQRGALIRTTVAFMSFGKESDSLSASLSAISPCFHRRVHRVSRRCLGDACLPRCLAAGRDVVVVIHSQSKLRRPWCRIILNDEVHHKPSEHSRADCTTIPHDVDGTRSDALPASVCVARTFLNADTSRWSSQGLRRECLLHIQGLHLHCGLLESCTPFPFPSHPFSFLALHHCLPSPLSLRLVTLLPSISPRSCKGVSLYTTYHGHCRGSDKKMYRRAALTEIPLFLDIFISFCCFQPAILFSLSLPTVSDAPRVKVNVTENL